jgi:uncharacterized protein (DUF305 family)
MKHRLRIIALPAAVAATLVLAGCGTSDTPGTSGTSGTSDTTTTASGASRAPASQTKNAADVEFLTMMIPHHAQAVEMADLALTQATDPKLKALAPKIKAAQAPEIELMTGWLTGWGEPVPAAAGGHDMPGMRDDTGGMMSAREMTVLGKANGPTFDRMWLQMMIRHHQGAVEQAKTELAQGTNPESKQLAQAIIDSQSAEITQMNAILAGVPV